MQSSKDEWRHTAVTIAATTKVLLVSGLLVSGLHATPPQAGVCHLPLQWNKKALCNDAELQAKSKEHTETAYAQPALEDCATQRSSHGDRSKVQS